MPRRWMPAYIKWKRGMAYEKKHLLSCFELRKLLKQAGFNSIRFSLPVVTPADWANLKGVERVGARIYVWLANFLLFRWLLILVSPAILAVARRGNHSPAWSRPKY